MRKILADTNFMLVQYEYGIDLPGELLRINNGPFVLLLPSGAVGELKMLAGRTGPRSAAARFVLANLDKVKSRFGVEIVPSEGPVDDWIIKYAQKNGVCVATNDVPLRRHLISHGTQVIAMKSKSKLDFV